MPEEPKSVLMHPQAAGGPIMAAPAEGEEDEDGVFGWFSQQQLDNVDIEEQDCPLFMDEEQLKDPKNAAQLEWLSSCTYEGMDGKEIALELKEKGNLVLKGDPVQAGAAKTKPNPKLAITMYDDALYQEHDDTVLKAMLWNNRAMANLKLKNWGHVMTDCVKSIRLNKTLKAYWRGAQVRCLREPAPELQLSDAPAPQLSDASAPQLSDASAPQLSDASEPVCPAHLSCSLSLSQSAFLSFSTP